MVLLTATPQILSAISSLPPPSLSSLKTSSESLPTSPGAPISHSNLIALCRLLRTPSKPQYSLNTLLRNTRPYTPPSAPPPPKSAEYLALMTRLRFEQEQRTYRALTSRSLTQTFDEEKDDIPPSLVINILVSIICVGGASFYMTRWWNNDGVRVLVSLLVAIVVGVAEVTVYAGYLRKVRESKDKERRMREKKVVVSSEEVSASTGERPVEKETEQIWGSGKHGGMRRRVREKWEKQQEGIDQQE